MIASEFIFVSGKIGQRGGSFESEAASALDAVEDELARAGATLTDVVSVTVYLTEMQTYGQFNEIYAARLPEPWPARAVVAVDALPGNARVQIQAVARQK